VENPLTSCAAPRVPPSTENPLTSCAAPSNAATDHFAEAGKMVGRVSEHRVSDHFVDVNKMVERRLTSDEKKALANPEKLEGA